MKTQQGFEIENGKLTIQNVIERLTAMRPTDEVFLEFDKKKQKDSIYCVEWGMLKQRDYERRVYDKMINDLKNVL